MTTSQYLHHWIDLLKHHAWWVVAACLLGGGLGWLSTQESLLFPWVIMLLLGAGLGLVIVRRPWHGLLLLLFFLPFERIGAIDLMGMTIRPSQGVLLLLLGSTLVWYLRRHQFNLPANPIIWPLAVFWIASLIGLLSAPNVERSVIVLGFQVFTCCAALIIPLLLRSPQQLPQAMRWLLAATLVVTCFGIFQFVGDWIGLPQSVTGLRDMYVKEVLGFPRVQSTALEPLYFANYLLIPLAVLLSLWFSKTTILRQWQVIGLLGLALLNLGLTVARGGYLAFVPVVLIIAVYYRRQVLRPRFLLCLSLALGLAVVAASQLLDLGVIAVQFFNHVTNLFAGASYAERVDTISSAWQALRQHPWFGIGPGSFGPWFAAHPYLIPDTGWNIVNNEYIELLVEHGVIGFGSMLALFGLIIYRSLQALRCPGSPEVKAILIALLAAWVGILVQYNTFSILYIMHIWCLIGLLIAVQNMLLTPLAADSGPSQL